MNSQAMKGFHHEGLKWLRLLSPPKLSFGTSLLMSQNATHAPLAHFSDASSLTVMIKFHISWSFLGCDPGPVLFGYSYFRRIPYQKCIILFVTFLFVSHIEALFLGRHGLVLIESCCCFDGLIFVNETSLLILRGLVACSFYFALTDLAVT